MTWQTVFEQAGGHKGFYLTRFQERTGEPPAPEPVGAGVAAVLHNFYDRVGYVVGQAAV